MRAPFGSDFINYWSGAYLALHGRAAEVYNFVAFHNFETSLIGSQIDFYHYSYPPVLLLLSAPLALLPYVPALFLWLGSTWYGFYRALKLAAGDKALLLSLAVPAVFINALTGQNGALTAAVLGGGLLLVDRRLAMAGILLGLLVYHLVLAGCLHRLLAPSARLYSTGTRGSDDTEQFGSRRYPPCRRADAAVDRCHPPVDRSQSPASPRTRGDDA